MSDRQSGSLQNRSPSLDLRRLENSSGSNRRVPAIRAAGRIARSTARNAKRDPDAGVPWSGSTDRASTDRKRSGRQIGPQGPHSPRNEKSSFPEYKRHVPPSLRE